MTRDNSEGIKTICLIGHQMPPFFIDTHPRSEAVERTAIDLWNAGFGVLAPHLNAPRAEGLVIPADLQLKFEERVIRSFADAVFLMPGWESDEDMWIRVRVAEAAGKPIFDSLPQLVRWREGKTYAAFRISLASGQQYSGAIPDIPEIRIAFVAGKYFVGEKVGENIIPNRNAIHDNIIAANNVAVLLWQEGIAAFTPHNNTHHFELKTRISEDIYQEFDRCVLQFVDGIVVLDNWVRSGGAKKEVAAGLLRGIPVIPSYDVESIRNWRDKRGAVHSIQTIILS